ncbi:MAG: phosphatidylserine decarboxylase [Fusobacteriaceae bacterium]|jgi:phosphatidylserine decarboxylase|nr:phosphatidylserine decarboxylase [Fusobacteriaceae bacterium]
MKAQKIKYIDRKTNEILIEDVPGENYLNFLYYNPFGKLPLHLAVKRKLFSSLYGKLMSSKGSQKKILYFIKKYNINMSESLKQVSDFSSFNDFFYRKLIPDARYVNTDKNVVVSPADGKILAFPDINEINSFFVKGNKFNLYSFFRDKDLSDKFKDGSFITVRLAPVDYHRFHFPYDGYINESKLINGDYFSVSPIAMRENFSVFLENKREFSILKTGIFGDIALFEIGATMVGSIYQTYPPNTSVIKGQEKGYFAFGGSTCIMLFEKGKIKIDEDILRNTKNMLETKIYMGEKIATLVK